MACLLELHFRETAPQILYSVHQEFVASSSSSRTPNSNFLRAAKWSPDGACLLTASDDNCLRIFDTPLDAFQLTQQPLHAPEAAEHGGAAAARAAGAEGGGAAATPAPGGRQPGDSLAPALRIQEGELLYDFQWYPGMSAAEPASCCLATTGRAQPVHLWDALTGQLRCSYRAYDDMDEVAPAHSLAFSCDGDRLFCGFNKCIRQFRVERPGRDCTVLTAYKKGGEGLPGIVSCLAPNPDRSGMLAAGSYSGAAALLDSRTRELLCLLEGGHSGGLTHLRFSACGNFLYTGARKDSAILCWDVRYTSGVLYGLQRASGGTNQRMYFDIEPCGRHLATGGEDGAVRLFDLKDGSLAAQFQAADDTGNSVAFHPFLPLLATASGQRRYPLAPREGESSSSSSSSSGSDEDGTAGAQGSKDVEMQDSGGSGGGSGGLQQQQQQPASGWAGLSAGENVLRVWRCDARPLAQPAAANGAEEAEPAAGTADGKAAAAGTADGAAAAADGPQGAAAAQQRRQVG